MNEDIDFIKMTYQIAEKSCCKKKKVGCLIAIDNKIVSIGYNCLDEYHFDCHCGECSQGIGNKCLMIIHAEQNAIFEAIHNNIDLSQATLYVNLSPCLPCARLIYGAGIRKIVFAEKYADYKKADVDLGMLFLQNLNVEMLQIKL